MTRGRDARVPTAVAAFDVAVTTGAGLRPTATAVDTPPDPTVRAPALDPTRKTCPDQYNHAMNAIQGEVT